MLALFRVNIDRWTFSNQGSTSNVDSRRTLDEVAMVLQHKADSLVGRSYGADKSSRANMLDLLRLALHKVLRAIDGIIGIGDAGDGCSESVSQPLLAPKWFIPRTNFT